MFTQSNLFLIINLLLIAGALTHGAIAIKGIDPVKEITGGGDYEKYVKITVGAAGLFTAYKLVASKL